MIGRNKKRQPELTLVPCDRSALEREAVRLAAFGTNAELHAAVARLAPHGKLKSVPGRKADSDDTQQPQLYACSRRSHLAKK